MRRSFEIVVAQSAQHEDLRPRQQRPVDLEGRILGGGADEDHGTVLDIGQERVLLRPVEAVDLIHEEDGPASTRPPRHLGGAQHVFDLLDSREDRAVGDELGARQARDQPGERGLAGARWTPEDHRGDAVRFDRPAQRTAPPDQIVLAEHLLEPFGAEAVGQRNFLARRGGAGIRSPAIRGVGVAVRTGRIGGRTEEIHASRLARRSETCQRLAPREGAGVFRRNPPSRRSSAGRGCRRPDRSRSRPNRSGRSDADRAPCRLREWSPPRHRRRARP